jgi:hypothetical protein
MEMKNKLRETPWDKRNFAFKTYELLDVDEELFKYIENIPGHFTLKVDPLSNNYLLYKYKFYYCDTLIEPHCERDKLVIFDHDEISIKNSCNFEVIRDISVGAYKHGRFHRDFNVDNQSADNRYINWLHDLYKENNCLYFYYKNDFAGYFGFTGNKIVLHALSEKYKGKGLAKYFWSKACRYLFDKGVNNIYSSISCVNLPVLNLYASIGFKFKNALDVYHKFNSI